MNKQIQRFIVGSLFAGFVLLVGVTAVFAAGDTVETKTVCTTTYGGATECHEVIREEVVHPTVDTGIVGNLMIAAGLFTAGYLILIVAQKGTKV